MNKSEKYRFSSDLINIQMKRQRKDKKIRKPDTAAAQTIHNFQYLSDKWAEICNLNHT